MQRKIHSEMLPSLAIHGSAYGFRRNRNIVSHAHNHVGKDILMLFDIEHCFHSITWRSIYTRFKHLDYSPEITKYLTGLCTHQLSRSSAIVKQLDSQQQKLLVQRHLPQGAPTSPTLSNIVMHSMDKRLAGLSKKLDLSLIHI